MFWLAIVPEREYQAKMNLPTLSSNSSALFSEQIFREHREILMEIGPRRTEASLTVNAAVRPKHARYANKWAFFIMLSAALLLSQNLNRSLAAPPNPATEPPDSHSQGLVLAPRWNSPVQGGSATLRDLGALLSPVAKAGNDLGPHPTLKVYGDIQGFCIIL